MRGRNRRGFCRLKNQSGGIADKKFKNRIILDVINMITSLCYLTHLLSLVRQATGIGSLGGLNGAFQRLSSYVK
jgi:hypothetical protein